jgi:prepilin-type N-terminal cleavage/methylation domain-containing protein
MKKGFTLIEIMVAVSLFAIVATITTGALVTASNVNRKAQAIKIAIDNLNFAIDSMVLNLQDGKQYHCISELVRDSDPWDSNGDYDDPATCLISAGKAIAFNYGLCPNAVCADRIIYRYHDGGSNNKSIQVWRESETAPSFVDITAPEIIINSFEVNVLDDNKKRVFLVIRGNINDNTNTEFNLQTTVYGR